MGDWIHALTDAETGETKQALIPTRETPVAYALDVRGDRLVVVTARHDEDRGWVHELDNRQTGETTTQVVTPDEPSKFRVKREGAPDAIFTFWYQEAEDDGA